MRGMRSVWVEPGDRFGGGARRWRRPLRDVNPRVATIDGMKEAPIKVTLTEPGIAGSYDVVERREDGTLVLRPETSDEVIEQFSNRPLSEADFTESFDRLDAALEREGR